MCSAGTAEQSVRTFPAPRGALFPGSLQGSLQVFPSELVFRVLSFLSAEDLTAAAPVCRHFRSAVSSNMLWRRLFVARCCSTLFPVTFSSRCQGPSPACDGSMPAHCCTCSVLVRVLALHNALLMQRLPCSDLGISERRQRLPRSGKGHLRGR